MITASPLWGAISLVVLLLMVLTGIPIAAAMGITGILFTWLFNGGMQGVVLLGSTAWSHAASYSLSMIPLFILMGEIVAETEVGKDAYDSFYKWLSRLKGSLAISTTLGCALFGAVTGSTAATIATIGSISAPEMKRRGYSRPLRLGCIACSGTLAALIPPSTVAIFYCVLTETSVGKVFIAGLVPGILLTILFCALIYAWVSLNPSVAPKSNESFSLKEKLIALKSPFPIVVIFIAVIGGLYVGFFSPTEAAGIGAVLTIVITLIMKRLTWQRFKNSMLSTVRITAFIMIIVIGAMIFARSLAFTMLPKYIGDLVLASGLSPLAFMFGVVCVFTFFGLFLDAFGLMVSLVPLFYGSIVALGFSPIWFGTMVVVLVELSLLTPPIAMHIFVSQALEPDGPITEVVRGVLPFYTCVVVLIVALIFFPQIALWLPSKM